MKHILNITLAILLVSNVNAQETIKIIPVEESTEVFEPENPNSNGIYELPEIPPEFPGGNDAMRQFVKKNIDYPTEANTNEESGKVYASFIVEPDGSISNIQIMRGVSPSLDAEAIRLIQLMPKWTPGKHESKDVRSTVRIPFNFQLNTITND